MGLIPEIIEQRYRTISADLDEWWRGWGESDLKNLNMRIYNAVFYVGGVVKITMRERRSLAENNRRVAASLNRPAVLVDFYAWVEGHGLQWLRRAE